MNLLITGAWQQAEKHIPDICSMGHDVKFMPWEDQALPCPPDWVEGIICNSFFLRHPIEAFPNLRFIQLTSAGTDRVPEQYIQEHDLQLFTARGVYSIPMAEHAVACVLWFYRGLGDFRKNQERRLWTKNRSLQELNGKTVLIVGCGNVGTVCAERFSAMGGRVIGIDHCVQSLDAFSEIWDINQLSSCLEKADIVILSVPLTEKTRHLINDDTLEKMKDGALLINICRGEVIDTDAVIRHLPRLGGVALDVFEEEPLAADSPLWGFENVLLTPHNSFVGDGNGERMKRLIVENLRQLQ